MPIYEYRCENGHNFEVTQRMTDDPVVVCQTCEAPVERVFHPVAVHFKGSGFYTTDYGRNRSGGGSSSDSGKEESKSESSGSESSGSESSGSESSKSESAGESEQTAPAKSDSTRP